MLSIEQRLDRMDRAARLAITQFELWFFLEGEAMQNSRSTLENYYWFKVPTEDALFTSCIAHSYKFVDSQRHAINIAKVWAELNLQHRLDTKAAAPMRKLIAKLEHMQAPVRTLRNHAVAHASGFLTRKQAFQLAGMTPNALGQFILNGIEAVNFMLRVHNVSEIDAKGLATRAREDMRRVIAALNGCSS